MSGQHLGLLSDGLHDKCINPYDSIQAQIGVTTCNNAASNTY